jgi:HAD superfamily hydrolase (TIGR01509 family)
MKTLVLDAMGVIYSVGDDVGELLCPFIAENGGVSDVQYIRDAYHSASLGKMSAEEFWRAVSIAPALEDEYLARHHLTDGALRALEGLHRQGRSIWCLSNDLSEWSRRLRERFELDRFILGFLISGDVGARKPARAIFDRLLHETGASPDDIVFVDDNVVNLDAAAQLGIRTILFGSNHANSDRHARVSGFDALMEVLAEAEG